VIVAKNFVRSRPEAFPVFPTVTGRLPRLPFGESSGEGLFGATGLDEVTGGGLPQGRPTLICGSAGCGCWPVAGNKGWRKIGEEPMELDDAALKGEKQDIYLHRVASNPTLLHHKGFKVTKTGKVKGHHGFTSHLMSARSANKRRNLRKPEVLFEGHARNMRKLMGISKLKPNKVIHERALAASGKTEETAKA
jgi:ribosomal protein L35